MPRSDPTDRTLIRLELRRFASRCETQESQLRRADSLREVVRLENVKITYRIAQEIESQEMRRRVQQLAETRAREIIEEQLSIFVRAEPGYREKQRGKMREDWRNLTGPLAHLRGWAQSKLNAAERDL